MKYSKCSLIVSTAVFIFMLQGLLSVAMAAPVPSGTPILFVDGIGDQDLTVTPTVLQVSSSVWNAGQLVGGVFQSIGTLPGGTLVDFAIQSVSNNTIVHSLTSAVAPNSIVAVTTLSGPSLIGQEQQPNPVGDYYNTIDIQWFVAGGAFPFSVTFGNAGANTDGFAAVPIPHAALLFGTGLIGLIGIARRSLFT